MQGTAENLQIRPLRVVGFDPKERVLPEGLTEEEQQLEAFFKRPLSPEERELLELRSKSLRVMLGNCDSLLPSASGWEDPWDSGR
jgi:hypothetical protein